MSSLFSGEYAFKGSTLGLAMALLRVYPKIGVGVYRTPQNFGKSVKWHSDRVKIYHGKSWVTKY